ncbi:MAG: peptidoglycan-binding protein [Rubellimicrobium sp.]|nr:peptidoglycan-binding protein [Rubellimicrobium sp.]
MRRLFAEVMLTALLTLMILGLGTGTVRAQERAVWLQIEARPTLGQAQDRARDYAARLENVAGFALGSGWYAIALGPFAGEDAAALRARLLAEGAIPGDSFLADGSGFGQQFWPIGAAPALALQSLPGAADEPTIDIPDPEAAVEPAPEPEPPPPPAPDETRAEAQAGEALLSRPEREALQIALQWLGLYAAGIDGAFGPGTRAAMSAWQEARGFEVTGVLTTAQRAALLGEYNAVLEGLDMQLVRDDATGIELQMPMGAVAFAGYAPPFARFDARDDDLPVTVLLISQPGDQTRLFGLYEIMQTLEIVPPEGPRSRSDTGFTLEGEDGRIHSYTQARLSGGAVKGFTLIWPAGDEERRTRVLALMQESFTSIDGVLDPAIAPPGEDQAVDLISGLAVRQPQLTRSGVFIDGRGRVLTSAEAVEVCDYITIDSAHEARVEHLDQDLGLAVLAPEVALAPLGVAAFQTGIPRLQAEVAVAGYPYGGVLSRPALTFGRLADLRGLNGEEGVRRLSLPAQPGDVGGPVFDNGGAVLGMLLPQQIGGAQILPDDVRYALDAGAIVASLTGAGIAVETTDTLAFITPEVLTRRAAGMTVLVSCW